DEDAGRAADALERAEREALELAVLPGLGDEHPGLGLLGDVTDLVERGALGADVRHLGELCVAQRRAVLRLNSDRHLLQSPRSKTDNVVLVQSTPATSATRVAEHARVARAVRRRSRWAPARRGAGR